MQVLIFLIISNHIAESIRIRRKCDRYEQDKKSTKKFSNLEKQRRNQNRTRNEKEIKGESEISNHQFFLWDPCSKVFWEMSSRYWSFSKELVSSCDIERTQKDLFECMKGMKNDKSPGNDGLSKELYETFWDNFKETLISSIRQAEEKKELSISKIDNHRRR